MDNHELKSRFTFHPATTEERQFAHGLIRTACLQLALTFNRELPVCRETSLAVTKLEEAMFWANAAVARQPEEIGEE